MTILNPRSTLGTTAFILPSDLNDDWTYMAGSGHYRTADLKAALGVDELGCGCDEADDNLKAAIKRAEDAEAFGAAAVKRAEEAEAKLAEVAQPAIEYVEGQGYTLDYSDIERHAIRLAVRDLEVLGIAHKQLVADKHAAEQHAEQHQYNRDLALKGRNEAQDRAEMAQAKAVALAAERDRLLATIERIDAVRRDFYEVRGDWADPQGAAALKAQMERAILGDPPFTLPTEAGALVSARNEYGDRYEFELWTNGADSRWMDTSGGYSPLDAAALLSDFTGHRLIGADQ